MKHLISMVPIGLLVLACTAVWADTNDTLFHNSFEAMPTGIIDAGSRFPEPNSTHGPMPGVRVGANFTVVRTLPPGTVSLFVDGVDVTLQSEVMDFGVRHDMPGPMSIGTHQVRVRVGDSVDTWTFDVVASPVVSDIEPSGVLQGSSNPPLVRARFTDAMRPIDVASISVLLDGAPLSSPAVVMDDPNTGALSVPVPTALAPGNHAVTVIVRNNVGARTEAVGAFFVPEATTHSVSTIAPADGAIVRDAEVTWRIHAEGNQSNPEFVQLPNGERWTPVSYADRPREFRVPVSLVPGSNTLTATVLFDDDTEQPITTTVIHDAPPVVFIDSPADFASLGVLTVPGVPVVPGSAADLTGTVARPVAINGRLSRPVTSVQINQQQAQLGVDGLTFQFPVFFLHEGTNLLSVVATDEFGRTGVAQRTVYVDQTAPLLTVESPAIDTVTSMSRIDVRGIANDAVEAQLGAVEPVVRVVNTTNGSSTDAEVGNRYFRAAGVPLELGLNRLDVVAQDAHGNERHQTISITRIGVGTNRLALMSGNDQQGALDTQLAEPLTVVALSADGLPMAGVPVQFDVMRGSGFLSPQPTPLPVGEGQLPPRHVAVETDAQGQASVWFTVGNEAGVFAHAVRARFDDGPEDVVFLAQAERGPAAWVLVHGASGSQYVQAGAEPVDALSVLVIDDERNPITDVPVRFLIEIGDARFPYAPAGGTLGDDGQSLTVRTDKNGVASVRPTAGPEAGTVRVRAQMVTNSGLFGAADFQLMVLPVTNAPTRFSGVVLDHAGVPLAGVQVSVSRTALSTTTDADGKFRFEAQVPVGKIDLHIDGTNLTVTRGNQVLQYPGLHFEVAVVAGQENQLPHPIYLPPINLSAAALVGGDEDVTLTVPGIDGFAMIVKANSVTFPDGSRTGPLVVTPVHGDRLPMVPPGGFATFGAIAWTIQPTGTRFDPPIEVRMPNSAGLKPGETLPIVQWDHDLATFVPMGRGTVDETGSIVVSDEGSGITKAGWGGGPPPTPPNCGDNPPPACRGDTCGDCPQCQVSQAQPGQQCPACRPDLSKVGKQCGESWCDRCKGNGQCGADPIGFPTTPPEAVSEATFTRPQLLFGPTRDNAKAEFHGLDNDSQTATWDFELDAYCNANGQWRFKIKKAEIRSKIVVNINQNWQAFNPIALQNNGPGPNQTQCEYYNAADFILRWSASSHFYSGGVPDPAQNPDVASLLALQWNKVTVPVWDTLYEIEAHENQHFVRFKRYVADSWESFENNIDLLTANITNYPTKEEVLESQRVKDHLRGSLRAFQRAVADLQSNQNGQGDHDPPSAFYACSMNALSSDFATIDAARTVASCPLPSRSFGSCPN